MGCNQSNDANDPTNKPTLMRNSSGIISAANAPGKMYESGIHSPENFALTMIGNTSTNGLILGFSGQSFDPIPCRLPIPRYCHALLRDKQTGFITGGIEDLETNISTKATLDFQILEGNISKKFIKVNMNKLIQDPTESFEPFPDMINARYAHCAIFVSGYLYAIGGRQYGTDESGLLSACERYDFDNKKWKAIPSMQYPRAAGAVLAYGDHIYVFGGYSGNNNRTRVIETYADGDSSWRKLPYLLPQGFEGALVLKKPNSQTSVLIFGGKRNIERSNQVIELNIDRSTVLGYCPMNQGRSFHKGKLINDQICLIGGGCQSVQLYSSLQQKTRVNKQISYLEYCTMKQLNSFSQFHQSIKLTYQKRLNEPANFINKVSVFGHAHQPFAYHINLDNMMVNSEGQSLSHYFYQFPNVIKVNKEYCFVLGGISCDLADVTSTVYSYNMLNSQIKYLQPMPNPRYAFGCAVLGSYLYVVGGRKLGDDQAAILGLCERFSFQTYQWEEIAPLKHRRQSATVVAISEFILVIGGYKGNGVRANELQLYIPQQNRWVELQSRFQLSVQGMNAVEFEGNRYLFGGRAASDIQKVFKLKLDIDTGVRYQKCLRPQLQPVGFLSSPGTNLKVHISQGMAYVFGNIPGGIDIYDLTKHKGAGQMPLKVFQGLSDPYFQSYTLIF